MSKPKLEAIEREDGNYDLRLVAPNGTVLWRDNQGRPKANVRRDWARIKLAVSMARFGYVNRPEPGSPNISPDTDPILPA